MMEIVPSAPDKLGIGPAPTTPPSMLKKIFVGPRGLRAGWKVVIFALLLVATSVCLRPLGKLSGTFDPKSPVPPGQAIWREFLSVLAMLVATGVMARFIDRKPWSYFGMPLHRAFRSSFWSGAAIGLFVLALQLQVMHWCGWFDYGTLELNGGAVIRYGLLWALAFLCVGISEEGVLRGYVQRVTTDGLSALPGSWSFWTSALVFSVIFAAGHLGNPGENKFGITMVFIDGMLMCFTLWRTGNLWFAIGNHAAWDWGQTFVFGTPNSGLHGQHALMSPSFHGPALLAGGADGPEGSLLVLLSEALVFVLVAIIYRRRTFPLLADTSRAEIPGEGGHTENSRV
jgi:membrane protease YdiL (CAAX protease family)